MEDRCNTYYKGFLYNRLGTYKKYDIMVHLKTLLIYIATNLFVSELPKFVKQRRLGLQELSLTPKDICFHFKMVNFAKQLLVLGYHCKWGIHPIL